MSDLPDTLEGLMRPPTDGPAPFVPSVECIGCGAEPGEECASCGATDCRACADEAEGWYGKPHTCEDGPW